MTTEGKAPQAGPVGKLRLFTVDTFTEEPFTGNPAAVCLDLPHEGLGDELMQKIAAEMNLSMTAFVNTVSDGDSLSTADVFTLRWFTPKMEWNLCGHATLATAFVLFKCLTESLGGCLSVSLLTSENSREALRFLTKGGELIVRREGDVLAMDFPTAVTTHQDLNEHSRILQVLFPDSGLVESVDLCVPLGFLVIRLKDKWTREEFEKWESNAQGLPSVDSSGKVKMVIVTTRGRYNDGYFNQSGKSYDFASRIFTPWSGLPEDPVTD